MQKHVSLIDQFGYVPRLVVELANNFEEELELQTREIQLANLATIRDVTGGAGPAGSNKILHMRVARNADGSWDFKHALRPVFASTAVEQMIFERVRLYEREALAALLRGGATGTLAGVFFELLAHGAIGKGGAWKLRWLSACVTASAPARGWSLEVAQLSLPPSDTESFDGLQVRCALRSD